MNVMIIVLMYLLTYSQFWYAYVSVGFEVKRGKILFRLLLACIYFWIALGLTIYHLFGEH